VRIPVGGSVVFHNAGRNAHNAISMDKSWSSEKTFGNITIPPDQMTEMVFPTAGVYPLYCTFHGTPDGKAGMVGVVIVGDAQYTPPCWQPWRAAGNGKSDRCYPPRAGGLPQYSDGR
jgi:hypothetical protein